MSSIVITEVRDSISYAFQDTLGTEYAFKLLTSSIATLKCETTGDTIVTDIICLDSKYYSFSAFMRWAGYCGIYITVLADWNRKGSRANDT